MKSLIKNLLVYGLLIIFSAPAQAIVNVEQAIIGQSKEGLQNKLDILANGASGNTEKSTTKADMLSLWKHDDHTEFLQLQYAYGKSNGKTDTDQAFAHLRHRTAITPAWAVEAFTQVGRNTFSRLTQRTLLGGGIRWTLFEEDVKSAGYLGLAAFHEKETLSDKLGTNDPIHSELWRASSYLVLKRKLNEQVRIYSTTYYQPATADPTDYRVLEQASMLVKMGENLDLKVSLDIAFDSKPPQTVQQRDVVYSTGLEFSF
ncbi:MAG: DUF481 domain-containing protein [Gallionellaceae bacterium]|nr:DUF481 domain-containing protein [Gallionellaceae bacterium]